MTGQGVTHGASRANGGTHRRLIGRLAATPIRLRHLLHGVDAELARRPPAAGEWSAAEVLLHLVEGDRDTFVPRLRQMLAEDTPVFWAAPVARAADLMLDVSVLLDVFAQARGQAVALLTSLGTDGWRRDGVSPSRGRLTVEGYAESMAAHDREHMRQVNQVRGAHGLRPLRCEAGDPMPLAEIVIAVAATPGRIEAAAAGLDAETLRRRPAADAWSMKEVMAHLLAVETRLFLPRLRGIRSEEWPQFPAFDPDAWAAERDWRLGDFHAELETFARVRSETVAFLRGLGHEDLERVGVTVAFGAVTLHEYATHVAEHDAEHLAQLELARR